MISRRSAIPSMLSLAAAAAMAGVAPAYGQRPDVVYVPTPHESVERMLRLADVRADDVVIDLGSGDGRIPIAAARRGARALGVEIDPARLREAEANARAAGVAGRVTFRQEDLFKTPLGEATVITLYLLPELNVRLSPRLMALRPGTRIVSHLFPMGDWQPDATDTAGGTLYLWVVPARVAGRWRLAHGGDTFTVELSQRYQEIAGTVRLSGGGAVPLREARLRGAAIEFTVDIAGEPLRFRGTVAGNAIKGTPGGFGFGPRQAGAWSAQRM